MHICGTRGRWVNCHCFSSYFSNAALTGPVLYCYCDIHSLCSLSWASKTLIRHNSLITGTFVTTGVQYRLMNGDRSLEGRVEIQHDGMWGGVCDSGWDDDDANVICRQLGYYGGDAISCVPRQCVLHEAGTILLTTHADLSCMPYLLFNHVFKDYDTLMPVSMPEE